MGEPGRHRLRHRAEPPDGVLGDEPVDRVGERDRHHVAVLHTSDRKVAGEQLGRVAQPAASDALLAARDGGPIGRGLGVHGEQTVAGDECHRDGSVREVRGALLEVRHHRLDLVRRCRPGRRSRAARSANWSAAPSANIRLNSSFAPRTASGLRAAISPASAIASSYGSSLRRVARPSCNASRAVEHPRREDQLLGDVGAHEVRQHERPGHVGHEAPVHLAHRELGVGMDDADVGAERDLDSAAERVPVHGGDHRHGHLLPHPADLLAEVGDPPVLDRGRGCRCAPSAVLSCPSAPAASPGTS